MGKAPFSGKIISVRFTDEKNSTIEVVYERDGTNIPFHLTVDESDPKFVALVDEGYDLEHISEATIEFNRSQNRALNNVIEWHVHKGTRDLVQDLKDEYAEKVRKEIDKIQATGSAEPVVMQKDAILEAVILHNDHEETLFKMKLAIFEQPDVKKARSRSKKMAIRKAKTLLDTLSAYNSLISVPEKDDI
jgi:hypothetical protein